MIVIPNSQVRLLSDVPFHLNYEHVRRFENESDQFTYFNSKPFQAFNDLTYQREETFIKVPMGYDKLYNYNYLMYQNKEFGGKWFYAFVTRKEYVNPETTRIYFEMDVFQSWQFQMEWNPSYIVREHRTRWNVDGTPVINTLDEGLDYGSAYKVVSAEQYLPSNGIYYLVVACKKAMHEGMTDTYYASVNGLPQLLVYYVHPFFLNGGSVASNLGGISPVEDFLAVLYTQTEAVNNVVSIYITDMLPNNPIYSNNSLAFATTNFQKVNLANQLNGVSVSTVFVTDQDYGSLNYVVGDKYDGYDEVTESKLLMFPYTLTEIVDMRGHKVTYKNEYINNDSLIISILGSLGVNQKTSYTVKDYLTGDLTDDIIKYQVNQEVGLINNDPNDLPIFTDLLGAYLQGNRNTLQHQKTQAITNVVTSTIGGTISGGTLGTLGGPVGAGAGALIGGTSALISSGISAFQQIQGMNAKQRDIANTPPQLSNMGSNPYFDYGNRLTGIWIIKRQITAEYQKRLTDFFKMFGYKVNELKLPNLKTRESFNFVQTSGAHIVGDIPQEPLSALKAIFNKGVTLWHGDFIGDYSRSNNEV